MYKKDKKTLSEFYKQVLDGKIKPEKSLYSQMEFKKIKCPKCGQTADLLRRPGKRDLFYCEWCFKKKKQIRKDLMANPFLPYYRGGYKDYKGKNPYDKDQW